MDSRVHTIEFLKKLYLLNEGEIPEEKFHPPMQYFTHLASQGLSVSIPQELEAANYASVDLDILGDTEYANNPDLKNCPGNEQIGYMDEIEAVIGRLDSHYKKKQ